MFHMAVLKLKPNNFLVVVINLSEIITCKCNKLVSTLQINCDLIRILLKLPLGIVAKYLT